MKYLAAVLVAATACGSSTPHDGPRAIELTVDTFDGATLLKLIYRDGDGPWQQAPKNSDGTYALTVTGAYEVFAVYEGLAEGTPIDEIEELRATVDDPPPAIASVAISRVPPQPALHVSGGIVGGGGVMVETPPGAQIPYATWSNNDFVVAAFDTSSYVFALGYNGSALATVARRSFEPGQDASVGLISLDIDGHAMLSQPVGVTNAISGGLSKPYVDVEGPGRLPLVEHAQLIGEGFEMPVLPPEVRLPDDHYTLTIQATASRIQQNYRSSDAAKLTAPIELLSPVDVAFTDNPASATWAIDDHDAELSASNGIVEHRVLATAGWLAATGASSLAIHEDVPDFNPDWRIYNLNHPALALALETRTATSVNSVTMSNY
jgi:hypothetical protein